MNRSRSTSTAPPSRKVALHRRLIGIFLGLLLLVVAGCSSPGSGGSNSDEKVTLTYGLWDQAQVPAMKQIIAGFHAEHPNIDVQIQVTPWETYWTKLQTAATAGTAPDVFWMTIMYAEYYAAGGAVLPLDDQIKKAGIDMNNYVDAIRTAYTYDDKIFGMPKDVNGFGLCYNKKLFDAAGVKYPDANWTWDDVISAAQKLTDPSKGVYGIAAPNADELTWYLTVPQTGGSIISADQKSSGYADANTIKGIEFWTDMITKYKVSPSLQQTTDTDPLALLTSGKIAMRYCGSWEPEEIAAVPYGKANIDIAPLPLGPNGNRNYYSNGLANEISAKSKHPEQAWQFVQYLSSKESAALQAETGTVIPAYKGQAEAYAKAMPEFDLHVMLDHLESAEPFPASADTAKWRDYATQQFASAFTGKSPTAAVSQTVATRMNELLGEEKR